MIVTLVRLPSFVTEAIVRASKVYARKEAVREKLQALVLQAIASGEIKSQKDLDEFFGSLDLARTALASIPLEVYLKLSSSKVR